MSEPNATCANCNHATPHEREFEFVISPRLFCEEKGCDCETFTPAPAPAVEFKCRVCELPLYQSSDLDDMDFESQEETHYACFDKRERPKVETRLKAEPPISNDVERCGLCSQLVSKHREVDGVLLCPITGNRIDHPNRQVFQPTDRPAKDALTINDTIHDIMHRPDSDWDEIWVNVNDLKAICHQYLFLTNPNAEMDALRAKVEKYEAMLGRFSVVDVWHNEELFSIMRTKEGRYWVFVKNEVFILFDTATLSEAYEALTKSDSKESE